MKILHTSDWHIGHAIYKDSQEHVHRHMLDQIVDIVKEQKPDAVVIAGDVYDTSQPSASAQHLFADALVEIHDAHPQTTIVCIAGNHDSGSRLIAYEAPWKKMNVHVIGEIKSDSELEDYIITIPDKGYIVAVPYASERFMPEDVYKQLSTLVRERNMENLPVVLTAHLAFLRSDFHGHEMISDDMVGGLSCQELDILGDGYDYVALGHIHRQQKLDDGGRVRYAGTPVAVSFDEVYSGNQHGVLMVDCEKHGALPSVEAIELESMQPLVNIPAEGAKPWDDVLTELKDYPDDIDSLIRLNVLVKDYLPAGARDEANNIVEGKRCKISYINSQREQVTPVAGEKANTLTSAELKQLNISDVVEMKMGAKGLTFDDEIKAMLAEIEEKLNQIEEN